MYPLHGQKNPARKINPLMEKSPVLHHLKHSQTSSYPLKTSQQETPENDHAANPDSVQDWTGKAFICENTRSGAAVLFHSSDLSQTTKVWQLRLWQLRLSHSSSELCKVKRSDTQTFSNFSNYFKRVLKLPKRFSSFSKVKRLQLKLTNNLQNKFTKSSS